MSTVAMQINDMVIQLNRPEQELLLEIVKRFMPEDEATSEEIERIKIAREEYERGDSIDFEDFEWGFTKEEAIQNNFPAENIELMRKDAGITELRLEELKASLQPR